MTYPITAVVRPSSLVSASNGALPADQLVDVVFAGVGTGRLHRQTAQLTRQGILGKLNGASGNYNALAFGWSTSDRLSDTFCSVAVFGKEYVHFGFYWGNQIADPEKKLEGKGNQYRYIKVYNKKDFPKAYISMLVKEAYANSLGKLKTGKQMIKGQTITKSISARKKRPE